MKAVLRAYLLSILIGAGSAYGGPDKENYAIQSLNTPDPIFTASGDSIQIRVNAESSAAARARWCGSTATR